MPGGLNIDSAWVNYMKKGESNPMHIHLPCDLSSVLYLDVPDELLEEQKNLLTHYITSFTDNSLELKMYLNTEIVRLKDELISARSLKEINEDGDMASKLEKIIEKLASFSSSEINDDVLLTVLKTQNLTKELSDNGLNN